ncbi:hypothetical protein KWH86_19540 [Enterobacter cloacae]|nr:hypothetical protein [Enterobacter cloacae]MCU6252579.1 hypothetical protein [Enterobacter cloacae]
MCLVLFAVGALTSWLYHDHLEKKQNTEACSVSVVVYHEDARANLTLDFMYTMQKQTGVIALSGTYFKNEKAIASIRRDVSYIWTENKDSFQFTSVKIHEVNEDSLPDNVLGDVLPDFFIYPNHKLNYTILKQGPRGFLFTVGKRPIFFCSR